MISGRNLRQLPQNRLSKEIHQGVRDFLNKPGLSRTIIDFNIPAPLYNELVREGMNERAEIFLSSEPGGKGKLYARISTKKEVVRTNGKKPVGLEVQILDARALSKLERAPHASIVRATADYGGMSDIMSSKYRGSLPRRVDRIPREINYP